MGFPTQEPQNSVASAGIWQERCGLVESRVILEYFRDVRFGSQVKRAAKLWVSRTSCLENC